MNLTERLTSQPTSMRVRTEIPHRNPYLPSVYLHCAWQTESGYVIRSWLDVLFMDEVLAARQRND